VGEGRNESLVAQLSIGSSPPGKAAAIANSSQAIAVWEFCPVCEAAMLGGNVEEARRHGTAEGQEAAKFAGVVGDEHPSVLVIEAARDVSPSDSE
jgi:hypothetical protein